MSKICVYILVAFVVAAVVGLPTPDEEAVLEDKPGYCKIGNIYIKEGEQDGGPIGRCMRMKCVSAEPGKIKISGVGCGTFVSGPGCIQTPYDNTKRYPHCCPKEVCNEISNEE